LAGDAVVFKQDSEYYEHFYSDLKPGVHYVPIKADLSDLVKKIQWAKTHDEEVRKIGINGRQYSVNHLLPKDVICYHAILFKVCLFSFFFKSYLQFFSFIFVEMEPETKKSNSSS
jgi:methionyl-tRNA synthetase